MRRVGSVITVSLVGWLALAAGAWAQESSGAKGPESPPKQPAATGQTVTIRVVDEAGKPARGVMVGSLLHRSIDESAEPKLTLAGEEDGPAMATDSGGLARVNAKLLFYQRGGARPMPVIAWDKATDGAGRIGMAKVEDKDIGGTLEVTLHPACRVAAHLTSTGLEKVGGKLGWANVYVFWGDMRPMQCDARDGVHDFWLPPGEYKLTAYGRDTDTEHRMVKIEPGQKALAVEIDLPPSRLAELTGRPAPELSQIKGWKNGGPVTLASLKGKVVLLDFWGYWCGPCVHSMPELMETHDKYKDRGLVIVAVHDDSVADIAEMDAKLEQARREIWSGKDLPFLVALDGGGEVKIEGHEGEARGATTAAYGIHAFPTTVLIDRNGNVVGQLYRGNKGIEQLEKALGEVRPPK